MQSKSVRVTCKCGDVLEASKRALAGKVAQNHAQTEPALSDGRDHSDYEVVELAMPPAKKPMRQRLNAYGNPTYEDGWQP